MNPALHAAGVTAGRLDFYGLPCTAMINTGTHAFWANIGAELNPAAVAVHPMTR